MYSYYVYYCILVVFCILGLKVLHGLRNQSINLSSLQSIADVSTDRGAYTSFPLPIIFLCVILMENEAI